MSLDIPDSFTFKLAGGVDLDLGGGMELALKGIPTEYSMRLKELAPIELRPIELKPIDISLRLKELPSIRAHFPLDFKVGFAILGRELMSVNLCGQAQAITEPYVPNPCESYPFRESDGGMHMGLPNPSPGGG